MSEKKKSETAMFGAFVRHPNDHWIPTKWFLSAISLLISLDIAINAWQFVQYYTQGQMLANHAARISVLERVEIPPRWLLDRLDRLESRLEKIHDDISDLEKKIGDG